MLLSGDESLSMSDGIMEHEQWAIVPTAGPLLMPSFVTSLSLGQTAFLFASYSRFGLVFCCSVNHLSNLTSLHYSNCCIYQTV